MTAAGETAAGNVGEGAGTGPRVRGQGFGHGKVILIGEHGVVHGHPALAAGLAAGVRAEAVAGSGWLAVPAWALEARAGDGSPAGRALEAILSRLGAADLDFRLDATIPSRAGLGSSAAMAVAIARAAAAARDGGGGDTAVRAAVDASEAVFHGSASGIDAAVAADGGIGRFRRGDGWSPIPVLQPITICVGLSGEPRDTAAQVDAVARLRHRAPVTAKVMDLFGDLVEDASRALALGDVAGLGRLFDVAHGLLCALRVSSPAIETLVHSARAAGAVGAKLTGAGGGGAVIALAPGHEGDVLVRWRRDGFAAFSTTIGGRGGAAAAVSSSAAAAAAVTG